MNKSFTLGAVSGISALALAFPAIAQIAGAQTATGSAQTPSTPTDRPAFHGERTPLSQDDVQEMVDRDNAFLLHIDAFVAIQKRAIQNHRIALQAAADIDDETERNAAVKAANVAMRTEIENAVAADPDLKDLKITPFGGPGMMKGPHGRSMMHGPEKLAKKLGMTAEELKAALDSGKTIEQIATERGITLPARPPMGGMWR